MDVMDEQGGVQSSQMSTEVAPVIDKAAIFALLFIHQPELTEKPHCCVTWPRWWISCHGECAGTRTQTRRKETLEQTRSVYTRGHERTHTTFKSFPLWMLSSAIWIYIVCLPNLPAYYFTWPQPVEDISSWVANGTLTCESHVDLDQQAERDLIHANLKCWHHLLTATSDLWVMRCTVITFFQRQPPKKHKEW